MEFLKFWTVFMIGSFISIAIAAWLQNRLEASEIHPAYLWFLGYVSGIIALVGAYIYSKHYKKSPGCNRGIKSTFIKEEIMSDQIILEPEVARQLEQLRIEGLYNMFDFNAIQDRAFDCDFFAAGEWMTDNKDKWRSLVMDGFAVNTGDEVLTHKKYFEKFPFPNLD